MKILGIESSCDDTSVALVKSSENEHTVIIQKTASQIDIHQKYGGVVPEIAGRAHAEKIIPLIEDVLKTTSKPDLIAVTAGPGLVTGLLVGLEAARTLAYAWNIPVVPINHIDGHIHSVEIDHSEHIVFPALALVVSGGHTELILLQDHGNYSIIGRTKDDAAGECFDKVAKLLNLTYPGGPQISKLAQTGNVSAIMFPRPMIHEGYDFSFSGLKTSALYWLRDHELSDTTTDPAAKISGSPSPTTATSPTTADFCASFEQAIIDVLVTKTLRAAAEFNPQTIILVGGVSANKKLRETLQDEIKNNFPKTNCLLSAPGYSMDNGAMIAVAGYYQFTKKGATPWSELGVDPNWKVDSLQKNDW